LDMGYTLVINPGSSSKKYALYNDGKCVLSMRFEQHAEGFEICSEINNTRQKCEEIKIAQFQNALDHFIETSLEMKYLESPEDIERVGVRVVAPGTYFQKHHLVDGVFMRKLEEKEETAPLHIPMALREIRQAGKKLPNAEIVAVSDSAFHSELPEVARTFSIPPEDARDLDIYRFGYHGISISSVLRKVPEVFGSDMQRLIVCHIGSGVSITALKNGKSIDTTMGYAPGGGVPMGSRSGDLEVDALLELMRKKHMRLFDARMYTQTEGGMRALCGSADLRTILERRSNNDPKAEAAFASFVYHIRKAIGAYIAVLGGLDGVVLTATACERNPRFRSLLLRGLESLGIELHAERNDLLIGKSGIISSSHSPIDVAVIKSDEQDELWRITEHFTL